ncbi:MAG: tetratricopeptide repeat protein, partial [Candidatus Adiutricales bacterium]
MKLERKTEIINKIAYPSLILIITVLILMPVFETSTAWAKTPSSGKPESVSSAPAKRFVFKDSFEQAVRLYQSGRYRQAGELLDRIYRKKLTIRQNRKVRFLRGSAAVRSGDSEVVLKAFDARANVLSGLDDYAAYFRALAYSRQGRWKKVQAELKTVFYLDPEGPLKRKANLLRAKTLVETGRLNQALREYRKLADGDATGEIHLKMGLIYQQKRRPDRARLAFKRASKRAEDSKIRSDASKRYKELLRSSLKVKRDEDLELEYIRLLRKERSLTQGLSRIEKLLSAGGSRQFIDDLAYEKGRALLLLKRRDQARQHLLQAARSAAPKSKFRFLNLYADSLRWEGRTDEAASAYIRAGTEARDKGNADSAFFKAGMLFFKADRLPEAEQAWQKIKTSERLGNYADRILWHTAWYYYNHKVWAEALERFQALSQRFPGRELGQAAQYWLGRTFERLGDLDEAGKHYFASAVKSQK